LNWGDLTKPKAYVIGQRGKHRNPLLVSSLGLSFEVIEDDGFVHWESIEVEGLVNHSAFRDVIGKSPMPAEIACFVAHARAWKWLAESEEDFLAVFEDDAEIRNDYLNFYIEQLPALRGNWQLALEMRSRDELLSHWLHRKPVIRQSRIQPRGAAAYIISKVAASALLMEMDRVHGIDGLADSSLTQAEVVDFYVCLPPVFAIAERTESIIGLEAKSRSFTYPRKGHDVGFIPGIVRLVSFIIRDRKNKRLFATYFKVRYFKAFKYGLSRHFWQRLLKLN
jgi:GR25 family glycosyltransferase involved in LPS biosynthesis